MCTSMTLQTKDFYFGRNLDLECGFGERVVLTPRGYVFSFRKEAPRRAQYAMIGMASVLDDYPLYAEAVNEKGLCIAGLNFPGNAYYAKEAAEGKDNISQFELIPWILSQCTTVAEAKALFERINLIDIPFREGMPLAELHWHIADRERSIVVEAMRDGVHIYDNPTGVLTNNPPFSFHLTNLNLYMNLTDRSPENRFSDLLSLKPFAQGMGAVGMPGDSSSTSRFVKAVFNRLHSSCAEGEGNAVGQFFHLLESVAMVEGTVLTPEGIFDKTTYSCCINADQGIYYYKTYGNSRITAVQMQKENLNGTELRQFPLISEQQINFVN